MPRRRRGRPRSDTAERAILRAAAQLLAERGVRRMSMEAIAVAAKVSKATIYRRWPSKDALVMDLIARAAGDDDDEGWLPAQMDARSELQRWVREGLAAERSPRGAALRHLLRRAAEDPALAASLVRRTLRSHRERFAAIVERGVRTGQIRPHVDAATLLDLLSGPVLYRQLIEPDAHAERDPDALARTIVDLVWPGIRRTDRAPSDRTPSPPEGEGWGGEDE
ncbi:MAG TPA: TetR/AcrR family transcriptional regulator [Candidatus Dormibacteraeota bacterium]|nr:TetR/AcrR family transcriptional regulator [Candidatus Dormibacteraeota bacterium]